jgi:hypothetical protein
LITFLSKVKYTISNAIIIGIYQISYNLKVVSLFANPEGSDGPSVCRVELPIDTKTRPFPYDSHPPLTETALTLLTSTNNK